ncbi:hypothetical protein MLD38_014285 [Melastoma candidum]|uniref:Uncharacterized protein n=1 Tax=Melastoma candidum TaxID=119954 RepID=A0ACB9RCV2_9MYRT|nr:hypothetical protein MLD38_014285 [Melastoma candidum]
MGAKKPRIVIIGAGMAGLTAAHELCTSARDEFEVLVVEAGSRIGGRINTSEFGPDRIELGATWIHGVGGSPVYEIASRIGSLSSDRPWECMDCSFEVRTVAEDGSEVTRAVSELVSALFDSLMDFAQGKAKVFEDGACSSQESKEEFRGIAAEALEACRSECGRARNPSIGSFLRKGLEIYWGRSGCGKDPRRNLDEEAVFAMNENIQRTYTSAGDLSSLDFWAEREYMTCSGEEITIANGYSSVVQHLASVLPPGTIRIGWEVVKIEWHPLANGHADSYPVTLHFRDRATIHADHVIVTVSLGVLKARTGPGTSLFSPPLPPFKTDAISRLGFGTVNKLFLHLTSAADNRVEFPFLQMAFHRPDSEFKNRAVPWWMRRTASLSPIHRNSDVLLSWFAGKEALHLETLTEEEILDEVSSAVNSMISPSDPGSAGVKFGKALRSKWGSDPLFLGSYSYVAVGSSGDDLDALAVPLPLTLPRGCSALQIMFAGEATHRTHYSTTHGAYYSGIREAVRLLKHYKCGGWTDYDG